MNDITPSATPTPLRRTRRWPWILLALLLALIALLALAPMLGSGAIASSVVRSFNAQRRGRLEIGSLELAWLSRQKLDGLRVLDASGNEVVRASLDLPALLDLARGGGTKVGSVQLRVSAELSADDDGSTNLARALELREPAAPEDDAGDAGAGEPLDLGKLLRELDLELELAVERVAWSDARTRALGRPFEIRGLTAKVRAEPGQPLRVSADGELAGERPGKLALQATLFDLADAHGLNPKARFELAAALDELPSALIDALAQQPGLVEMALGPQFRVQANGAGTLDSGTLELGIAGDRGRIAFAGALESGVLKGKASEALAVALQPERAALARFVAANVPPELTLEPIGDARIDLVVKELVVDVAGVLEALNAKRDVVQAAVAGAQFDAQLSSCGWKATGAALPLAQGVSLDAPRVALRLVPDEAARVLEVQAEGALGAGASGFVSMQARCADLARFLAADPRQLLAATSGDEPRFDATLMLQQVESATLSAFVPSDVPLAELLGRALDVRLAIGNANARRSMRLSLVSPTLSAQGEAWMEQGLLVDVGPQPWSVRFAAPPAALAKTLATRLPAGLELRPGAAFALELGRGWRVPLDELRASPDVVATLLQRSNVDLKVSLDAFGVRNQALAAKNQWLTLEQLALDVHLGHGQDPRPLEIRARMGLEGEELTLRAACPRPGALDALVDPLALPELELELAAARLPLEKLRAFLASDAALAELGPTAGVTLRANVVQSASHTWTAKCNAELALAANKTTLALDATVEDPLQRGAPRPSGALPPISARFELAGLRVLEGFLSPELAATVLELSGDTLRGELVNAPAAGSQGLDDTKLRATLDAARCAFSMAAAVRGGVLTLADAPLELRVDPSSAMVARYAGSSLPQGAKLEFQDAAPRFSVRATRLELPLDAWLVQEGAQPATLASVVRRAAAEVRVELPKLSYTQPALDGKSPAIPVALEGLALDVRLTPQAAARLRLGGKISGAKVSELDFSADIADPGAFVERAADAPLPALEVAGKVQGLPTALVDALAAQKGLLVDVLGPEMALSVDGTYPSTTDPLRAEMTSPTTSVMLVAHLETQTLEARGTEGLDARLPLTPLFSERIVGKLVPLLVNATKPEGAPPVTMKVSAFSLPLDGDLRKLNATVALDLGEIGYELLPGLGQQLSGVGLGALGRQSTKLPPLSIPIVKGVAGYDALPLSIRGKTYTFKGKYDLVTSEMTLASSVPLSLLGKSVAKELDKVRDYVDPNLLVPIEISGTWKSPKLGVGKKFLEDLLENAAGKALEGGLRDLLGGKKKDKKD